VREGAAPRVGSANPRQLQAFAWHGLCVRRLA
jgi:hypothetical protein